MEECVYTSGYDSKGKTAKKGNGEGNKGEKGKRREGIDGFERRADGTRGSGEWRRAAMRPVELKFLYLNARSVMNKLDELAVVVEMHRPDVVGIMSLGRRRR